MCKKQIDDMIYTVLKRALPISELNEYEHYINELSDVVNWFIKGELL